MMATLQAEPISPEIAGAGNSEDTKIPFGIGERLAVIASGPLSSIAIIGIMPVLPQIAQALEPGSNTFLTKQLVGVVGLAMGLGSPLAGFLISRLSPRQFMTATSLLYAVAGTAGLYLSNLPILLASRFFVGLAAVAYVILAITLINTRLEGVERAKWMGIQVSIAMISSLAISPISGALGELSWRFPFALYALGFPASIAAWLWLDGQIPPSVATSRPRGLSWYPWRFAALALVIGSVTYIPVIYGPFLMRGLGAKSPTFIGLILTADSILGALVAMLYGRSRKILSASQTFAFSFAFTALGGALAAFAPILPLAIAGMLVSGIGMGWLIPNLVTSLATFVSLEDQSKAAGITKCFHYFASPLCIFAVEPVAARMGPAGAMLMGAVLSFALFLVWCSVALRARQKI